MIVEPLPDEGIEPAADLYEKMHVLGVGKVAMLVPVQVLIDQQHYQEEKVSTQLPEGVVPLNEQLRPVIKKIFTRPGQVEARLGDSEAKWVSAKLEDVSYTPPDPDMMTLIVDDHFEAAHRLPGHEGKCARLHGHSYAVKVTLRGPIQKNGMVVDFYEVRRAIERLDHQYLNDFFSDPTAEVVARWLLGNIPYAIKVQLWEGLGGQSVVANV